MSPTVSATARVTSAVGSIELTPHANESRPRTSGASATVSSRRFLRRSAAPESAKAGIGQDLSDRRWGGGDRHRRTRRLLMQDQEWPDTSDLNLGPESLAVRAMRQAV